jgi:hypothetical protein
MRNKTLIKNDSNIPGAKYSDHRGHKKWINIFFWVGDVEIKDKKYQSWINVNALSLLDFYPVSCNVG